MRTGTAVRIDDDLAAGKPGIALGAADDERTGRVDMVNNVFTEQFRRDDVLDDFVNDILADLFLGDILMVLRRHNDRLDTDRFAVPVTDADLSLPVGAKVRNDPLFPHLGQPFGNAVRQVDRHRHQHLGLAASVAEHQPLVSGSDLAPFAGDALVDLGRLLPDRVEHGRGTVVETVGRVGIADLFDHSAHDVLHRGVRMGFQFACNDAKSV